MSGGLGELRNAVVLGATTEAFQQCAENAKKGCPISRLLRAEITMDARLV